MNERPQPGRGFPVRLCFAPIPAGAKSVELSAVTLKLPVPRPQRIVILGDSGCRLKGAVIQACNDPDQWPFARVAARAAAERPDLVIHVGDYHYRETPCPEGDARCAGTPHGDNWAVWNADFFTPAGPLLRAAPWLTVRGNHEDCRRAGIGWTFLLGSDPVVSPCAAHEAPRRIDLGGVTAIVFDDNDADDTGDAKIAAQLHEEIESNLDRDPVWLLFHHPVRGVHLLPAGQRTAIGANATLVSAFAGIDEASVQLILSGHIHTFQAESFEQGHAPQLIAGTGGDRLDAEAPPRFPGVQSGDAIVHDGASNPDFGYVVMERSSSGWSIGLHAPDGTLRRRCSLAGRDLTCP